VKKRALELNEALYYRVANEMGLSKAAADQVLASGQEQFKSFSGSLSAEDRGAMFALAVRLLSYGRLLMFDPHFALDQALREAGGAGTVMCNAVHDHEEKGESPDVVQ
jgi:hypothetical protein